MSEDTIKFTDRRNEPKPERKPLIMYPKCPTCRHFDPQTNGTGMCVIEPPKIISQIRGEDAQGNMLWASWCGYPVVNALTRCSKHSAVESN